MRMNAGASIASAVATERKLAGLTQQQLASSAHVSVSLVRAVEQGRVPASPSFVAAAARALGLGVAELQGQPQLPRTPDDRRVKSVIPGLRREIAAYRLPGDDRIRPRPIDALAVAVGSVSRRRHAGDLASIGEELPSLLAELRTHLTEHPADERAYGLLALCYAAVGQVAYKLGYTDLSSLATDRVEWAAALSGDELAAAAADFYRAGELIATADWDTASRFLDGARGRISHRLDDEADRALHGQLHLKSGLAAARCGDIAATDAHIAEAEQLGASVSEDRNDYDLAFNRYNVAVWSVGLAVEAMDGVKALNRAQGVQLPDWFPPERIGHHWIDMARGHLLAGDKNGAFAALRNARSVSPQQTKYHPQVHETARMLAATERRRSDGLAHLVSWLGVDL